MQCEITVDGRLIITLEKDQKTIKVWYNTHKEESANGDINHNRVASGTSKSPFQPAGDSMDSPTNKIINQQNKTRKIPSTTDLKLKLLAGLNDDDDEEKENFEVESHESTLELDYYLLLNHKSSITNFKLLKPDLYESFKNSIPTIMATMTERGWVYLWYENLMDKDIAFMCAHVFKPDNGIINDIGFLDFPPINPEKYHDLIEKESRIFHPEKYKLKILNKMGIYQNTYDGMTYDWIFLLKNNKFDLFRAEGLRNFPIKNVNIVFKSEVELAQKFLPRVHPPVKILSISTRDFNDKISFYGLNTSHQIVKYRRDLNQKSTKGQWFFRNILMVRHNYITDIIIHNDFPISMNLTASNELMFYVEEQSNSFTWAIHKTIKYIGQYNHNKPIKQIKFINKIPGVLILNEEGSMTIVC